MTSRSGILEVNFNCTVTQGIYSSIIICKHIINLNKSITCKFYFCLNDWGFYIITWVFLSYGLNQVRLVLSPDYPITIISEFYLTNLLFVIWSYLCISFFQEILPHFLENMTRINNIRYIIMVNLKFFRYHFCCLQPELTFNFIVKRYI